MQDTGLLMAQIVLLGMLCQWAAWRARLPAILFLLLAGLAAGPVFGILDPDAMFGELLMPVVSLSVAIILFEGSLTLDFQEIRGVTRVVQRMITWGALVTWTVVAFATHWIFDFSWQVSALFGAIVIVTGPTVIVPMLRSVRPSQKLANILRWEGIAIDPIGALAAVMTYEFILLSVEGAAISQVLVHFLQALATGGLIGVLAGVVLGRLLVHNLIPEYLHNLVTLSIVLISFSVSNALQHESGLLAVTVMGMWLANKRDVDIHPILNFKEHLSVLLISVLFIVLAARIDLNTLADIAWQALALLLVLQFVARPAKILVSTMGLDVNWRERALLAWIAPRGIVAAAISAIFADKLIAAGHSDAELLVPLTFSVIIGTVILQSATSRPLARWLGVAEPAPKGFLIVGANSFARAVAQELTRHGFRCVLADSNYENIRQARMAGLETFYGNPVSEHADIHLDLSGIGSLLALSHQHNINVIAAIHYRADFGAGRIFSLANSDTGKAGKHAVSGRFQGERLFGNDVDLQTLMRAVADGQTIKSTTLGDAFDWQTYQSNYGDRRPLFVIDARGFVRPVTANGRLAPGKGATILALAEDRKSSAVVDEGAGDDQSDDQSTVLGAT